MDEKRLRLYYVSQKRFLLNFQVLKILLSKCQKRNVLKKKCLQRRRFIFSCFTLSLTKACAFLYQAAAKPSDQKERTSIANIFYCRVSGFEAGICFITRIHLIRFVKEYNVQFVSCICQVITFICVSGRFEQSVLEM